MLIIKYSKNGDPIPDDECEDLVIDSSSRSIPITTHLIVSTDNIINAARALLAEGRITNSDVKIFVEGTQLEIGDDGVVMNGSVLPDHELKWARRTVMAGIERRKKKSAASDGVDNIKNKC